MIITLKNVIASIVLSTEYKLFCQNSKMHVFIMLPFLSDISTWCQKYIVNMWGNVCFCSNICYHFAKDILFFYIMIYHLCISWLSWDFISWYIIYHDYRSITTLYITATQAKELDSLYQVQLGVSIQPHSTACAPSQGNCLSSLHCISYMYFFTYWSHRNI